MQDTPNLSDISDSSKREPYMQPMTINSFYNEFPAMPWKIGAFILGLAGVCSFVFLLGCLADDHNQQVAFYLFSLLLAGIDVYYLAQMMRAWLATTPIQRMQALKAIKLGELS
mmetsp:Transcript_33982/g.59223  ORF Transcript_33982/g.59223 Transcript_33982/m.59223 type:complete len:113 (+) Transcript_33982:537-875(+)